MYTLDESIIISVPIMLLDEDFVTSWFYTNRILQDELQHKFICVNFILKDSLWRLSTDPNYFVGWGHRNLVISAYG